MSTRKHFEKVRRRIGAGDGIRTRDINLGKVALYQLSYSREGKLRSPSGEFHCRAVAEELSNATQGIQLHAGLVWED